MIFEIPDQLKENEIILCIVNGIRDERGCEAYFAIWYDAISPPLFGLPPVRGQMCYGVVAEAVRQLQNNRMFVRVREPIAPLARSYVQPFRVAPAPDGHHPLCSRTDRCGGQCMEPQAAAEGSPR